jgi:4'-phosphopantetheinyl transferase
VRSAARTSWEVAHPGADLPLDEVHVWRADANRWSGNRDVLSLEEDARAARFRFDLDRRRWVAARVLLRNVLGRYLEVDPSGLELGATEDGRPVVLWPRDAAWLCFSISHAGEAALVAVARGQRVGVDVEEVQPGLDVVAVAQRALGNEEAQELARESEPRRTQRFFAMWTQEEARGKCRGTGLIEPNDERRHGPLDVAELPIGDGYAAALAVSDRLHDVRCFLVNV